MSASADTVLREVTSWEGVTARPGGSGTVELRLGRQVLGVLPRPEASSPLRSPLGGLVEERAVIARLREAYERARAGLDRRAGVPA